jgi:hypothetical protein
LLVALTLSQTPLAPTTPTADAALVWVDRSSLRPLLAFGVESERKGEREREREREKERERERERGATKKTK